LNKSWKDNQKKYVIQLVIMYLQNMSLSHTHIRVELIALMVYC